MTSSAEGPMQEMRPTPRGGRYAVGLGTFRCAYAEIVEHPGGVLQEHIMLVTDAAPWRMVQMTIEHPQGLVGERTDLRSRDGRRWAVTITEATSDGAGRSSGDGE